MLLGADSYTGQTTIVPGTLTINQSALSHVSTSGVILTAVPEPSGILLAGLSLAGLLYARRLFGRKS
jgi:hypothetical protein